MSGSYRPDVDFDGEPGPEVESGILLAAEPARDSGNIQIGPDVAAWKARLAGLDASAVTIMVHAHVRDITRRAQFEAGREGKTRQQTQLLAAILLAEVDASRKPLLERTSETPSETPKTQENAKEAPPEPKTVPATPSARLATPPIPKESRPTNPRVRVIPPPLPTEFVRMASRRGLSEIPPKDGVSLSRYLLAVPVASAVPAELVRRQDERDAEVFSRGYRAAPEGADRSARRVAGSDPDSGRYSLIAQPRSRRSK